MKRTALILAAAALAAVATTTSASAAPTDGCPTCVPLVNVVAWLDSGIVRQLFPQQWWTRPRQAVGTLPDEVVPMSTPVWSTSLPGVFDAVHTFEVAQLKFLAAYRAFPQRPTQRQWATKYRPLIRQAMTVDTSILNVISTYVSAQSAKWQAEYADCVALSGGDRSECTFPDDPGNTFLGVPAQVTADRAALAVLLPAKLTVG